MIIVFFGKKMNNHVLPIVVFKVVEILVVGDEVVQLYPPT